MLSTHLHADGRYHDLLYVDGGPGSTGKVGYLRMQGREVFRHAVVLLAAAVDEARAAHGLGADDIDWFVPHQANRRIIDAMAKRLGLSKRELEQLEAFLSSLAAPPAPHILQ